MRPPNRQVADSPQDTPGHAVKLDIPFRPGAILAVSLLGLMAAIWLATLDVTVAERGVDGQPAACGSAYDVALIKRDGYMGGEVPANQDEIDEACRSEARRDMAFAGLLAVPALIGCGYATVVLTRRKRLSSPPDN